MHLTYGERQRQLGLLSLKNRRLWEGLVNVYNKCDGKQQGRWARVFSAVPNKRTRGNGHELEELPLK